MLAIASDQLGHDLGIVRQAGRSQHPVERIAADAGLESAPQLGEPVRSRTEAAPQLAGHGPEAASDEIPLQEERVIQIEGHGRDHLPNRSSETNTASS